MTHSGERIGFVGAGKMAQALAAAIIEGGISPPQEIICSDPLPERLQEIRERYDLCVTEDNQEVFRKADIVFLAFKPQNFPQAVEACRPSVRSDQIIISIMAGVQIERIQSVLPGRVVRVMPNTGCLVGEMAAGFTAAPEVSQTDVERVQKILHAAGVALRVNEEELDAVTGLSGSGPAFVAYLIDACITAGKTEGLSEETARELTLKTFAGTARLLSDWNIPPRELIQMVSSPGGTTVAGREILESSDVGEILNRTIRRAAQRSRELA